MVKSIKSSRSRRPAKAAAKSSRANKPVSAGGRGRAKAAAPKRKQAAKPARTRTKAAAAAVKSPAGAKPSGVKSAALAPAKWVYAFGGGKAEGKSRMRDLLGGKGANLAEMANLGLPVPPGFTITTEVCTYFYRHGKTYPKELEGEVE
jgi:pyruvate,orthophosphate dikinase